MRIMRVCVSVVKGSCAGLDANLCLVQARTYPDLLKSPHDEALMEYYCQSSLVYIDVRLPHHATLIRPAASCMVKRGAVVPL